jgi:hypothetical protein
LFFASARKAENEKRTEPTRIRLSIEGVQKRYKTKKGKKTKPQKTHFTTTKTQYKICVLQKTTKYTNKFSGGTYEQKQHTVQNISGRKRDAQRMV